MVKMTKCRQLYTHMYTRGTHMYTFLRPTDPYLRPNEGKYGSKHG